ncbi:MAG: DUF1667 domain-containing protein [Candidatus Omnitrophica bacterium]|nr:DUF1667 domain-containing protein [Candidatus Omnitrophota bacterium]
MSKQFICIECPNSCLLVVETKDGKVTGVSGNKCKRGETYAVSEVENPVRNFTSLVKAEGLEIKMVPVKTSAPIQKGLIFFAAQEVKKIRIVKPVKVGEVIAENFVNSKADLIATRDVSLA